MTCDNSATNKDFMEELEKDWKEHWKDNPPKYEGIIRIGGDEEGMTVFSSISPAMYPSIFETLFKTNKLAFTAALEVLRRKLELSYSDNDNSDSEGNEADETPE